MHEKSVAVDDILSSRLLIIAPHMDDEVLGCGGTMLLHRSKEQVHCLYVTAGERSPSPLLPWQGRANQDLPQLREQEAYNALAHIGIPKDNATFMRFADGRLTNQKTQLAQQLQREIERIDPAIICVPFHYDLHTDHIAVHRAVRKLQRTGAVAAPVLEYFIYFRWPLIRERDIRRRVPQNRLLQIDTAPVAAAKGAAIACYQSQTQILYPWQEAPVLTQANIRQRLADPEYLLLSDPDRPLGADLSGSAMWLRIAHLAQTYGKRPKDQLLALCKQFARPTTIQQ